MKDKIKKEFKEEIQKELGYISAIFMSQGEIKAKNIVMPTEELLEASDRICLYLSTSLTQAREDERKKKGKISKKELYIRGLTKEAIEWIHPTGNKSLTDVYFEGKKPVERLNNIIKL